MNSGGEPERDDTGLPPVDIEIPDDARELDRDVQAYFRELRAERRRMRRRRLHRSLARDGFILPLLACCLILALITGTLLTIFTATSDQNLTQVPGYGTSTSGPHTGSSAARGPASGRPASSGPASSSTASHTAPAARPPAARLAPSPAVVQTGRPLPAGTLSLDGNREPVRLDRLGKSLLVLVPPRCRCDATISWLAGISSSRGVATYLVGTPQTISEVRQLHSRLTAGLRAAAAVAFDKQGVLADNYPVRGLTAVLVIAHPPLAQSAAYAQSLSAKDNPAPLVQALSG